MMLEALELPDVSAALEDELDLILVDEFQDTSPIQLALFLKLANLAKHAVFVGDIKQAIYAFRGSDPELMQAVLRSVQQKGGKTDILKNSWRSCPSLVHYTNAVFTPVFSHLMSAEKVELTPVRSEIKGETAVEHWALKGSNKEKRAAALAHGIRRLVDRGPLVHDRKLDQQRPVRFDDIAILTRTNPNVESFAQALAAEGIPVKRTRTGLAATPEVCLALACLRRLLDSYDTLASAEIVALNDGCPPESWLEDRLRYLAKGHPGHLWGEVDAYAHPVLSVLAENRREVAGLSPSEAVSLSIQLADIRRTVQSWGPNRQRARQRVQNLDALIRLAEDYEERSETQHRTATANDFILWIKDHAAAKLDNQPEDPEAEAVQVLTHHAAKGLEWPVVVATGLEDRVWSRLWNVGVVTDRSEIDLKNPLADRFIRYWPWPFGGHSKGIPMVDRVNASQTAQTCKALDIAEHQRLLYVSLTRARDLMILVLPERKTSGEWMETLNAPWMIPTGDTLILPDGKAIKTAARVLEESAEAVSSEIRDSAFWFGPRATPHEKLPLLIRPHAKAPAETAFVKLVKKTGAGIDVVRSPAAEALGQALHAVIAAETVNPSSEDAHEVTKRIIEAHGLSVHLEPQGVLGAVRAFLEFVQREFNPQRLWAEYPITHVLDNGQIVKGWIDLLIETDAHWVIIDHKSTSKNENRLKESSLKYSGQLFCYKEAVEAASGKKAECWIHYPVSGHLIRLE